MENLYRSEVIEASEFEVLSQWFEYVVNSSDIDLEVDLVVYLRTEPEKVQNHFVALPKKGLNTVNHRFNNYTNFTPLSSFLAVAYMLFNKPISCPILLTNIFSFP